MSTRRALLIVFGGSISILVVAFVLGRWVVHGPVRSGSLEQSVASEAGALSGGDGCDRLRAARTWRCDVSTDGGSSVVPYFVVVDPGSSCWRARLTERVYPGDEPALRGCVHLLQWLVG